MRETFLYDPHCEFCMRGVRSMRRHGIDIDALAYTDVDLERWGLTAKDAQREAWLVSERRVLGGGDSILGALQHGPGWLSLPATVALRTPIKHVSRWVYRRVAANRHRLGWMFRGTAAGSRT